MDPKAMKLGEKALWQPDQFASFRDQTVQSLSRTFSIGQDQILSFLSQNILPAPFLEYFWTSPAPNSLSPTRITAAWGGNRLRT
jgi:hypothetical protein